MGKVLELGMPEEGTRGGHRDRQGRGLKLGHCNQVTPGDKAAWGGAGTNNPLGSAGDCGRPPTLPSAEPDGRTNDSYEAGARVPYKCRPGYVPHGSQAPHAVCQGSVWSSVSDFCTAKRCSPPEIPNGGLGENANLLFGGTIHFICNEGYRLIGNTTAQCILAGTDVVWSSIPYCEIIPCEPPPEIAHGQFTANEQNFIFGSTVTYSCDQSFALIGESKIHCTSDDKLNGKWSGPAPECKVVRCENPDVKNGEKVSGFGTVYTYKNAVTFQCKPGYLMNGSSVITCEADSTWKPTPPLCNPGSCGPPPSFTFAGLTGTVNSQYAMGTKLTYTCKPGYTAASGTSSVVTCLTNATWSANSKFCTRQQCSTPQIKDGKVLGDNFEFETTVAFTCNAGFKLNGPSSATCDISGNGVDWNTAFPTCESKRNCAQSYQANSWSCCGVPALLGSLVWSYLCLKLL
ncbi:membrane cofactor protein-like [Eudromia elegans]